PVEPVEDDLEALQNVDPPLELRQKKLETPADRVESKIEKAEQHLRQVQSLRNQGPMLVGNEGRTVVGEVLLQGGVLVEIGHDCLGVRSAFELQHQPQAVRFIGMV